MRNKKWYDWLLAVSFVSMTGLCIVLNLTGAQRGSLSNVIVNAVMFVLVGVIFLNCDLNSFVPMNQVMSDLENAAARIKADALNSRTYLRDVYRDGNVQLFSTEYMKDLYKEYLFDLERTENADKDYYKTDICDYVNTDIVDTLMHRNQLNQVSGAMTGLGILGTFIGLTLGLQSFNTGTTAEVTSSIAPLMDGIKVAFHTSIYGMIFSLVFNYVYKRKLYEAESAVSVFTAAYKKHVLPDTSNEGINRSIELQKEQLSAIRSLTTHITEEMIKVMKPQFDSLNGTINAFASVATRSQMEAMGVVVDRFIAEMNKSLGNAMSKLAATVDAECSAQQQSMQLMQQILAETGSSASTLNEINRVTSRLITAYNDYTQSVQTIQNAIAGNMTTLGTQQESGQQLIRQQQKLIGDQDARMHEFRVAMIQLGKNYEQAAVNTENACRDLTDAIDDLRELMEKQQVKGSRRV